MNLNGKRTIQIICLLLVMFPVLSVSTLQVVGSMGNFPTTMTASAADLFIENFNDITYRHTDTDVAGWGTGTVTNERDYSFMALDFYDTLNPVYDIEIQGRKAFVVEFNMTSYFETVAAFNINDPLNIRKYSHRNSLSGLRSIAMDGDFLYAGAAASSYASNGMAIYNTSIINNLQDPSVFIDQDYCAGAVTDIAVQGHLVYFASYNDADGISIRICETLNPNFNIDYEPNWSSNKTLGLEINRNTAYLAAADEGLYIVNISSKYNVVELGHLALPGNATDVILDGNIAYVTLAEAGIAAINVANPTNPVLLDVYDTPGITRHMALQGNTLFVTDGAFGVIVLDVVDPTHITYALNIMTPYCHDVELMDAFVFIGTDSGIHSFKLASNAGGITDLSTTVNRIIDTGFDVVDIEVIGDTAYIAGGDDGLYTMNVRDPLNPYLLDRWNATGYSFEEIDVNGQFAHLVDFANGEVIIDIGNPNDLRFVNDVAGGTINDILSIGGLTFVAFENFIGIGNNTLPYDGFTLLDSLPIGLNNTCIDVEGRYIYVGTYLGGSGDGFYIFDYLDPTNVQLLYTRGGLMAFHQEMYVEGDIMFTANGRWLHLWNISDYSTTYMSDYINYGVDDIVTDVMPFGHYVLITKNTLGAAIVDATDPGDIIELTSYTDATAAKNFDLEGDYMYVCNRTSLVVLRYFESAADTYSNTPHVARSTDVFTMPNGSILSATIDADFFSVTDNPDFLVFELSADGGTTWQTFGLGVEYNFTNTGRNLQFRVTFNGYDYKSTHLENIVINFEFAYDSPTGGPLSPLWIGIIAGGAGLLVIALIITVVVVSKKKKTPTR